MKIKVIKRVRDGDLVIPEGTFDKEHFGRILQKLSKEKQKELMRNSEEMD